MEEPGCCAGARVKEKGRRVLFYFFVYLILIDGVRCGGLVEELLQE